MVIASTAVGKFQVKANKKAIPETRVATRVGMIAGGTGITPMFQLIKQIFKDSMDEIEIWLLFANQVHVNF